MNVRTPAFTLLELLISASILAGLSVLLTASISSVIVSYSDHAEATKSNIQGRLILRQLQEAVASATTAQVMRQNDTPDSELALKIPSRDASGAVSAGQYDLLLYCLPSGSGTLELFRVNNTTTPSLTNAAATYGPCDSTLINTVDASASGLGLTVQSTALTDNDVRVIAFDVRQVGSFDSPGNTATVATQFPAFRIELVTRFATSGIVRASQRHTAPPPQLLTETVIVGSSGAVPNGIMSGT